MTKITVDKALIEQALSGLLREPLGADHSDIRQKLRVVLEQPAVEPVTDEENELFSKDVSSFTESDPEATKYALEQFLKRRSPPPPAEVPLLTGVEIGDMWRLAERGDDSWSSPTYLRFAIAIEQAVRQKAGLK